MSSTSPQSPPKRPRLSLQIKALANGPSVRTSRCLAAAVDVKSPTAFNTLSNVYATAVDRSTPVQENPPTAILGKRPVLRLQTQNVAAKNSGTHTPYLGPYLDTPLTAQPISPAVAQQICFPSAAMTATPPLSAQPPEQSAQVFTFDGTTPATALPPGTAAPVQATQNPKRRTTMPAGSTKLPYTHPRSLRSILRNSPLPPLSTKSPESPRRQSLRLQEKAARRVAYNSPLTQEITTSKYTKSHIDLLAEDSTPISPSTSSSDDGDSLLDQAMACDNTRDGGQTPGPFEEMRRRMANMHASTPMALSPTGGGIRKRGGKRREKKRRWVWTIGQDEDAEDEGMAAVPAQPTSAKNGPVPSVPVLAVPAPRPRTRNQQAQAQLAKAIAAATGTQTEAQTPVPRLAAPVPPARTAATTTPSPPQPAPASEPAPQPTPQPHPLRQHPHHHHHQQQQRQTRELTPIPSSLLPTRHSTPDSTASGANSVRYLTPEPPTARAMSMSSMSMHFSTGMDIGTGPESMNAEPPTPSVESTTSVQSRDDSSAFGDVEMSDASSFTSVEEEDDDGSKGIGYGENKKGHDEDVEMDDSEGTPTMTARPVVGGFEGRGWVPWRDGDGVVS